MINKLTYEQITAQRPTLAQLKDEARFPITVILENIRSLYNVGAMFRTSDGARIEKLYICGFTARPPRKEIDKTALGSTESVPWEWRQDSLEVIREHRDKGYRIVALEHTDHSVAHETADYGFPLCLIMGNEVDGVSPEAVALSDMAIEIPMYGIKQSLNVAVAYGIAVYRIVEEFRKRT